MGTIEGLRQQEQDLRNQLSAIKKQILDTQFNDDQKKAFKKNFIKLEKDRQDIVKKIIEEWETLSEEVRTTKIEFQSEIEIYKAEMATWENESYFADTYGIVINDIKEKLDQTKEIVENQPKFKEITTYPKNLYSYEGFMKALDELENQLKAMKHNLKGTSTTKSGKDTLRITRRKLDERIKMIEKMKKNKEKYQRRSEKRDEKRKKKNSNQEIVSSAQEISSIDVANYLEIFNEFEPLKRDSANAQAGKLSNEADFPLNSKEQVTTDIKEQERYYKKQKELNNLLRDASVLKIFNNNETFLRQALQGVMNGKIDAAHQVYYQALFHWLGQHIANYSFIYTEFIACAKKNKTFSQYIGYDIANGNGIGNARDMVIPTTPSRGPRTSSYKNLNWGETFTAGGINGTLRKVFDQFPNLSEQQKATRSSLTSLAVVGFGIFKGIQWLFKSTEKGGMKWWQKGLTLAGVTLGTQVLLGENPISLVHKLMAGGLSFNEFKERFKNSTTFFGGKEVENYQKNYSLLNCFGTMTPAELQNNMKVWEKSPADWDAFYTPMLQKYGTYPAFKDLGPKYDASKFTARLHTIGIGIPAIGLENMLISDIQKRMETNQTLMDNYSTKYGLKANGDKQKEINTYLAHQDLSDPKTLERMYKEELFIANSNAAYTERDQDITYLATMENTIKTKLTTLSSEEQEKLYRGAALFYNERFIDNKPTFEFTQEGEKIYMISHTTEDGRTQKIEIDVKNRSLPHLAKNGIPLEFPDIREMIRVAYLSNGLLNITKDFTTHNAKPFEFRSIRTTLQLKTRIPASGSGIYFDNKKRNERGLETQMLSYGTLFGRFGKMDDVSEIIHKNPEVYSDYLNHLWKERKENVSPTDTARQEFENLVDGSHTKAQVEVLTLPDHEKLELQKTLNSIWSNLSEPEKTLGNLSISASAFGSFGQETAINPVDRTISGLTTAEGEQIRCSSLKEFLGTTNLINMIKYTTKDQEPYFESGKSYPFYIDNLGRISFKRKDGSDETLIGSATDMITQIFNSSFTQEHKKDLVTYLNTWFVNKDKK